MNKAEFIEECFNRGICRKKRALEYVKNKSKNYEYTEKDLENVYSFDDAITNGTRMWANYVSPDPEGINQENLWAFDSEHVPIRRRKLIDGKFVVVDK